MGFKFDKTNLVLIHSLDYGKVTTDIGKSLSGKRVLYISYNKTWPAIEELFKNRKISEKNFFYLDAISGSMKKVNSSDRCYFLSSPSSLTELSLAIKKILNQEFDFIVFDSITNLSTYNSNIIVERFFSSLINDMKSVENLRSIFLVLDVEDQQQIIKKAQTYADKVIDTAQKSNN
ncbi:hypothetical protein HYW76_00175 [Candidatus Pacearchaeota archaeon]|nr:hypothetical protein [Candidatus Pacearchaeota archaeon]